MKILPKKTKEYICIFTIPVVTKKEGEFFIFFALDAYSQYAITFEVMPDNSQRDYQDFIKLVSNKENIDGSIIILDLVKISENEKAELLNSTTKLKDIIADPVSCNAFTKTAREDWNKRFS